MLKPPDKIISNLPQTKRHPVDVAGFLFHQQYDIEMNLGVFGGLLSIFYMF